MLEVIIRNMHVNVVSEMERPVVYNGLFRLDGKAATGHHLNGSYGEYNGVEWFILTYTWKQLYFAIPKIFPTWLTEQRRMHDAVYRAVPRIPLRELTATIALERDDDMRTPEAYAKYRWTTLDGDVITVKERGGRRSSGATFQGIAPYPVPHYDLTEHR